MKLLIMMLFALVVSCQHDCKDQELIYVDESMLSDTFHDGSTVDEVNVYGNNLYRHSELGMGCTISRTRLVERDGLMYMRRNGTTETCKGNGCSHCAFKSGGGCECKNSTNSCDHIISKNSDILRRLP